MVELSAIWVVVIVLVGIAIGVYSVCKGCQGMQEHAAQTAQQDRMTVHSLVAPYAGLVQHGPEDAANQSRLFLISEASLHDKNPPSYDEIIEPPPSYEETVKSGAEACVAVDDSQDFGSTHVNLACDLTLEESGGASFAAAAAATTAHNCSSSSSVSVESEKSTGVSQSTSVDIDT